MKITITTYNATYITNEEKLASADWSPYDGVLDDGDNDGWDDISAVVDAERDGVPVKLIVVSSWNETEGYSSIYAGEINDVSEAEFLGEGGHYLHANDIQNIAKTDVPTEPA